MPGAQAARPAQRQRAGPLRLHLGCGHRRIPGFIHVDAQALPHVDFVAAVAHPDMLPDGTADLIDASHVLEHFG